MSWSDRLYRTLLLCYPAEFRLEYGPEMTQVFHDRRRREPLPALWLELIADIGITASREHFHMLLNDLRYALRTMRKTPAFSLAVILTLALGIGANTAIFSVVNAEMLRPLPFPEPNRLVALSEKNDKLNIQNFGTSVLNYVSWKEQARSFQAIGIVGFASFNLTSGGDPEQLTGSRVSASIFPLLGLRPVAGRAFREDEDGLTAPPVAMISEGLWKRRFGGDASLIGKTVQMNDIAYTIVGIAPAATGTLTGGDVWIPLRFDPSKELRLNHVVQAVARLKPGVTLEQAQAEMDAVAHHVGQQYPEVRDWGVQVISFFHFLIPQDLRTALVVLLGAVIFVLLIGCANVANLLLARAAARQNEIAVRTAIGAGRGRLVRQLLTESLLFSAAGGAAGLSIGFLALRLLNRSLPPTLLPIPDIAIDPQVLVFTLALTLATGLLFGLAPAWQAARTDLNTILKQGGRSSSGTARPMLRNGLVALELAMATLLLTGAGLLIESLVKLQQVPLGFRPQNLLTFQLAPPATKYPPPARSWVLYRDFLASLQAVPGIRGAALSSGIPLGAGNYTRTPTSPLGASQLPAGASYPVDWRTTSPGYFRVMEIPLLRGRDFNEQDTPDSPRVIILSQQAAQKFWGDQDPIGRQVRLSTSPPFTVVGVVGDVRMNSVSLDPRPAMYFAAAARQWPLMDVVVRTAGDPMAALPAVRQRLRELDSELPMNNVRTQEDWVGANSAQPRLNTILLAVFAGLALVIAAVGIFGVLTYSVNRRTREIGVRMALGAQRSTVLGFVVREGMVVSLAGIGAGLAASLVVNRALATLVFGVNPRDPATFALVAAALSAVALAACYFPARRATRIDPLTALRDE